MTSCVVTGFGACKEIVDFLTSPFPRGGRVFGWMLVVACSTVSPGAAAADTRLVDAVKAGKRDVVRALLQQRGADTPEPDGTTALHWAVLADDAEMVRLLLRAGADASAANRYGVTPLAAAATNGSAGSLEALLEAGADPNAELPEGETVLMTAARTGKVEALDVLLLYGADFNAREPWYGETPLIWAAAHNHAAAARTLIEHGADVDARSTVTTVGRGGRRGGWTPLMYAARQGALEAVHALAGAGAVLNLTDSDGATALVLAIINAHYDVAAALLTAGADPNIADRTGMAALYAAVDMRTLPAPFGKPDRKPAGKISSLELLKMLLAHGAKPNAPLKGTLIQRHRTPGDTALGEGATPFMRAARQGDLEAMRLLLEHGADPALEQADHTTALMLAAGRGWRDGFPIKPPFLSVPDRATERDAIDAIRLCLELGADINASNTDGNTALHGAADERGSVAIVRFLVEHGARVDAKNKAGQTPLDAAFAHRDRNGTLLRTDVVAELRKLTGN
jgi:ankyrin repeat protein